MADLRKALAAKELPTDDEHCVVQAMFPQELDAYYKSKDQPAPAAAPKPAATPVKKGPAETITLSDNARHYNIAVQGKQYTVAVEEV